MTKLINNYKLIELNDTDDNTKLIDLNEINFEENNILLINTEKTTKDLILLCLNDVFEEYFQIDKIVTKPITVNLNNKSKIPYFADLLKIKGFLVDKNKLELFKNEFFILEFKNNKNTRNYNIPFSFLIAMNNLIEINDKYFINFNHDYFFGPHFPIALFNTLTMKLSCEISNNINIEIIFEYTFLERELRKKIMWFDNQIIKQITFTTLQFNNNCYENNNVILRNIVDGLLINLPKIMIESIDLKFYLKNKNDDTKAYYDILNYNSELISIYGEEINSTMTYFSFVCTDKFNNYRKYGVKQSIYTVCFYDAPSFNGVNFNKVDGVSLRVNLKNNLNNELIVYFPYYSTINYGYISEIKPKPKTEIANYCLSFFKNLFSNKIKTN
jgi:hypothetical protein